MIDNAKVEDTKLFVIGEENIHSSHDYSSDMKKEEIKKQFVSTGNLS